jgi:hypothetical protein
MRLVDTPQFKRGKDVEAFLDAFFRARGWQIEPTTAREERTLCLGDRHFRKAGLHVLVEYKSGLQTGATGNLFFETISVDRENKPGWVYTCQADFIFYAALLNGVILVFRPPALREQIEGLKAQFRVVKTSKQQNAGYDTHGVIVPLAYAVQHLADKVIEI